MAGGLDNQNGEVLKDLRRSFRRSFKPISQTNEYKSRNIGSLKPSKPSHCCTELNKHIIQHAPPPYSFQFTNDTATNTALEKKDYNGDNSSNFLTLYIF